MALYDHVLHPGAFHPFIGNESHVTNCLAGCDAKALSTLHWRLQSPISPIFALGDQPLPPPRYATGYTIRRTQYDRPS